MLSPTQYQGAGPRRSDGTVVRRQGPSRRRRGRRSESRSARGGCPPDAVEGLTITANLIGSRWDRRFSLIVSARRVEVPATTPTSRRNARTSSRTPAFERPTSADAAARAHGR